MSSSPRTSLAPAPEARVATGPPRYLTGVQGLRTVAALLVAIYHIWFARVSGGVDVFFVVAGYFATTSLMKMRTGDGMAGSLRHIVAYWLRTARRVIPSASVVIAGTAIACILWAPASQWGAYLDSGFAALGFRENWYLIGVGTDYLQQDVGAPVFQQFWALAVQVQFYLLMPLIVAAGLWLTTRFRHGLIGLLSLVFVLSFAFSVYLTNLDQPTAYFHTATRLWEFMAGGILALVLVRGLRNKTLALALGYGGVIALISLGALVDVSSLFPGAIALIPVSAAVAIIVSSASGRDPWILRAKPVVWFGNASFAFYLWHWPILVIFRFRFQETVGLRGGLAILALSTVLALVTTRFVEDPIRNWKRIQRSAVATILTCLLVLAPAFAALTWWEHERTSDAREAQAMLSELQEEIAEEIGEEEHDVGDEGGDQESPRELIPSPVIAREDNVEAYERGCHQREDEDEVIRCEWGDPSAAGTIVVVGGSHSAQWIDALREVADEVDAKVVSITMTGCVFGDLDQIEGLETTPACGRWAKAALADVVDSSPDLVVTIATRRLDGVEEIPQGFVSFFEELSEGGIPVLGIRDNPWFPFDPPECAEQQIHGGPVCGIERSSFYRDDIAAQIPDLPGFTFVDISDEVCPDDFCPVIDGRILMYRDRHHLTKTWTLARGDTVRDAVRQAFA